MGFIGLQKFLGNGVQFFANLSATTYVGIKVATSPASSFYLNLPTALPGSTQAVFVDSSGNVSFGATGTVSSVALSLPSIFSVSGSPVTTTGTLSATLASQTANTVLAAPNGSNGSPSFRALVAADIPSLLASKISDFDSQVRTSRLDQMSVPTATVSFNSQRISNLSDPSSAQDAATKAYVDAIAQGLDVKASCRAATTASITLSGTQTIDGVSLLAGDRVLVKNQSTGSQNGIYVVASGAWSRATDADASSEVTPGAFTFIEEGTTNADSGWILTTDAPITLGTTALTFTQFSGAGQIVAGAGLTKTGNSLDVGAGSGIQVNADDIQISPSYVGQTSITTLGTIGTGTWQGTAIAVANGGTGASSAATARSNLSAAGIYRLAFTNSDLVGGVLAINPGLGQQYGAAIVIDNSNKVIVPDDVTYSSATSWAIDLTSFGTLSGTWRVVALA